MARRAPPAQAWPRAAWRPWPPRAAESPTSRPAGSWHQRFDQGPDLVVREERVLSAAIHGLHERKLLAQHVGLQLGGVLVLGSARFTRHQLDGRELADAPSALSRAGLRRRGLRLALAE